MAFKVLRGTNAQRLLITPAEGELVFVTNYTATSVRPLWIGDGSTVGGVPVDAPASLTFTGVASDITSDANNTRDIGAVGNVYAEGHFTNIYGALTGNASTATYASAVSLTADNATNATNFPLFASAATGNLSPRTDTGFTYNPSTGNLTSTAFTGNLTGNVTGSVIAADSTVLFNHTNKDAKVRAIFGTMGAVLQTSTNSIADPVVIGSATDPHGLYIYADNSASGGADATLTISGVAGTQSGTRMVFETTGSGGTLNAPTNVLAGDQIASIEFRGRYTDAFGTYYASTGLIASEVVSLGATDIEGVVATLVPNASGAFERFNMASNGTFNSKTAIFGTAGDLVTPGLSNIPAGVALDVRGIAKLEIRIAPPASPVNGMIAIANGTSWNPTASGIQTVVAYINGAWVALS